MQEVKVKVYGLLILAQEINKFYSQIMQKMQFTKTTANTFQPSWEMC